MKKSVSIFLIVSTIIIFFLLLFIGFMNTAKAEEYPFPTFELPSETPLPTYYDPVFTLDTPSPTGNINPADVITDSYIPGSPRFRQYRRTINPTRALTEEYWYYSFSGNGTPSTIVPSYVQYANNDNRWPIYFNPLDSDNICSTLVVNQDVLVLDVNWATSSQIYIAEGEKVDFSVTFSNFYYAFSNDFQPSVNCNINVRIQYYDNTYDLVSLDVDFSDFISRGAAIANFTLDNNSGQSIKSLTVFCVIRPYTNDYTAASDYGNCLITFDSCSMTIRIGEAPIPDTPTGKGNVIRKWLIGWLIPSQEELQSFLVAQVNNVDSGGAGESLNFFKRLINALIGNNSSLQNTTLNVPAFSINVRGTDYQFFNGYTFDLSSISSTNIFVYSRMFGDLFLIFGFLRLMWHYFNVFINGRYTKGLDDKEE